MNALENIRAELDGYDDTDLIKVRYVRQMLDSCTFTERPKEPFSIKVSEKEPDEVSEEVTVRFFANTLKCRWRDYVIYNIEWLKKNWQMEMDIVCGVKPCEDAVSRQAVLEISKQHTLTDDYWALQNLPSVRPQEQTGHWIDYSDEGYVECPFCEHATNCEGNIDELHYCFWCGAKMVEPRESEDKG